MPREKPLKLPGTFEEALGDLLKVKPPSKEKVKRQKPKRNRAAPRVKGSV